MFARPVARWRAGVGVALVALFAIFLVSTVWLYFNNDVQRRQLALSVRSSGWISYQAKLEYVKLDAVLGVCRLTPQSCDAADLGLRAALLASRLDILANSEEGALIPSIKSYSEELRADYASLARLSDAIAANPAMAVIRAEEITQTYAPLGETLQNILRDAVLYNTDIQAREDLLRKLDASTAFALLMLSGAGLIGFMALEVRQRSALLREVISLRAAEAELNAATVGLLEALPAAVVVLTGSNRVGFANAAAKAFAASTGAGDDLDRLAAGLPSLGLRHVPGGPPQETAYVGTDGAIRHLAIAASRIRWAGEEARAVIIVDNTQLHDSELRAMAVAKLAVLGELSSAIAHELNQPLAVVKAAAANGKMLVANGADPGKIADKFTRIDDQVERARRIVQNIRRLGRPDEQDWKPFSVLRSINASFGIVGQQYQIAGIELVPDLGLDEQVVVTGDPTLFEIAIINILINARDAFEDDRCPEATRRVRVEARYETGELALTIADNAGGIPEAILPRMFESFVTSKAPDKGTGLGLSIARRAIERMKGTISARNEGSGALFAMTIPASLANAVS